MEEKNTLAIFSDFKKNLDEFIEKINGLTDNPDFFSKNVFVENFASNMNHLYDSACEVQKIDHHEAQEIAVIVKNIFTQPLTIKSNKSISIKHALENFQPEKKEDCDFYFILKEYASNPNSTKSFVNELKFLCEDFNTILRNIA